MKSAVACEEIVESMTAYMVKNLPADEQGQIGEHLRNCPACRESYQRYEAVDHLLEGSVGPQALSPDFRRETGWELRSTQARRDDEEVLPLAAPDRSFLDELQGRMGAAPWWLISGAFHALVLLLVTLIGMAILNAREESTVIVTDLEQKREPEKIEEPVKRDVIPKPQPVVEPEVDSDQLPIFTHEEVEISDHVETADDSDAQDTRGEDGISDVWLGGSGNVAALGLGGGGGGAFGRPGGAGGRLRRAVRGGGGRATESAVDKALEWLARHQEADGHWSCRKTEGREDWDLGLTGLATLAFLGAGHTEKIGKYRDNVVRAVAWMISQQQAKGAIGNGTEKFGYHHSICGMALAEAYGMARIKATGEAAQKAVNWTVDKHQKGNGSEKLGWRYVPQDPLGDVSNSGWFIMQIKSAKVAGLGVDPASFEGAIKFLDKHQSDAAGIKKVDDGYDTGDHRYFYNKQYTEARAITTAIGVLGRLFTGTAPQKVAGAASWLLQTEPPRWSKEMAPGVLKKNTFPFYYNYYATLVMFQVGGEHWKRWNPAMKNMLVPNQRRDGDFDGSWDPIGPKEKDAGRTYSTALGALALEVYYRYLPMYRE